MDETYPKEIMGYHVNPKKKVYFGSVLLKDVPGALAGVATALGKEGINLIASESANIEGTRNSTWGFFAESPGPVDIEKVKKTIEATGFSTKVEIVEGSDGVVVDKLHYPLKFNTGQQAMAFRREDVVDMFNRVRRIFGSGANLIIYEMGVATGESDAKALMDTVGGREGLLAHILDLVHLYAAEGWGRPEIVDLAFDPVKSTVRMNDSFECMYAKSKVPNGHFIRGHLVGLGGLLFEKKIKCEEVRCVAMGDPYCEYVVEETP